MRDAIRWVAIGLIGLAAAWLLAHTAAPPPPPPPPDTARVALGWRLLADRRLAVGR
ncbi:hypothetical protein EKD04_023820, partial [Chloroflexales bacterium ZM16-3]|nr:hypothetical protein [Chloroflexales bacterium ZM16-3]